MDRREELATNLQRVYHRIETATKAAGRKPGSVQLLPVSKFQPLSDIRIVRDCGVTAFGENREQEARAKAAEVSGVDFHMIGQIQLKKANSVARWASMIHSVDSERLAKALDRGVNLAVTRGERDVDKLPCLVQLSLDGDPARGGVVADELEGVAELMSQLPHLSFSGLMCVPPISWDKDKAFAQAHEQVRKLEEKFEKKLEFSAGMSADMVEAIYHGSTMVRVGTEIFRPRRLT